ncbi:MAG: hypothetical protein LBB58_04575 [Cellulomonadaceae bacterium]|nr:hypothetical protein [Cellulomonadaceae bacterium]
MVASPLPYTPTTPSKGNALTWPTFASILKPHWVLLAGGGVAGIVATVANLWLPRMLEYVIEALALGVTTTPYIVRLSIITVIGAVAAIVQWMLTARAGENAVFDARTRLIDRFLHGRLGEVLKHAGGDLIARATTDAPLLQLAVSSGIVSFLTAAAGVIGTIVFMGVIDPLMLALTLGAVAILTIIMFAFTPKAGRERVAAQSSTGVMAGQLETAMRARAEDRTSADDVEAQYLAALTSAKAARRHGIAAINAENLSFLAGVGGMSIVTVFLLAFGAWRVAGGYLSIAALVAFVMYASNFFTPLVELATGFTSIQSGLAASKRISEAIAIPLD